MAVITLDELKSHNDKNSLYILIHQKVYDVTKFLDEHPGGDEVILAESGQDATEAFEDVGHSDEARELLPGLLIGEFEQTGDIKLKSGPSANKDRAAAAVEQGSNLAYFVPLALLGGYFAWRFYSGSG